MYDEAATRLVGMFKENFRKYAPNVTADVANVMSMVLCRRPFLKKGRMMKEVTRHKIKIAVDSEYSQERADWLNKKGHVASVGRTAENLINGVRTADDNHANMILMQLWEEFSTDGIYVS